MSLVDLAMQTFVNEILSEGVEINTRNSVCKRVMNQNVTFTETPLLTLRKTAWKSALREMEWFLSGSCNINDLHPSVHKWWKPWATENGTIPNNYSVQFRYSAGAADDGQIGETDQIQYLEHAIKEHPFSRRSVITTWNTTEMTSKQTPITNCHGTVIQAFVNPDNSLHLTMYQRSSDMILGMPHNWIQYWALLMYLAHKGGREVGTFTWIGGDCHIYESHFEVAKEMSNFNLFKNNIETPGLIYTPTSTDFKADDFSLDGEYKPIITKSPGMVV
jgi:thymidylate synthase